MNRMHRWPRRAATRAGRACLPASRLPLGSTKRSAYDALAASPGPDTTRASTVSAAPACPSWSALCAVGSMLYSHTLARLPAGRPAAASAATAACGAAPRTTHLGARHSQRRLHAPCTSHVRLRPSLHNPRCRRGVRGCPGLQRCCTSLERRSSTGSRQRVACSSTNKAQQRRTHLRSAPRSRCCTQHLTAGRT